MSKRFDRTRAGSEHVGDLLSPYIDNTLIKSEQTQVREHLEVCADCRADYIELRATWQMLRSLPTAPPPRAFTLTQEMVAARPGFWHRLLAPRNSQRFALGSALSFTLLVFLLLGNFVTSSRLATSAAAPAMSAPRPDNEWAAKSADGGLTTDTSNKSNFEAGTVGTPQITGMRSGAPGPPGTLPTPTSEAIIVAAPPATMSTSDMETGGQSALPAGGVNPKPLTPQPTTSRIALAPPAAVVTGSASENSGVSASTVSSPSTHTLDNQSGIATYQQSPGGLYAGTPKPLAQNDNGTPVTGAQPLGDEAINRKNNDLSPSLIVEASLALLGVALAVGAFVARRR